MPIGGFPVPVYFCYCVRSGYYNHKLRLLEQRTHNRSKPLATHYFRLLQPGIYSRVTPCYRRALIRTSYLGTGGSLVGDGILQAQEDGQSKIARVLS